MAPVNIEEATKISLEYVAKKDPEAQKAEILSVKRKDKGWHVEMSWGVQGDISGVQYAEVTLSQDGEVEGYEKTRFVGGGVIRHRA